MKIKQSFIDRCGEITVNQMSVISLLSNKPYLHVAHVLLDPQLWNSANEVLRATANVLEIDLSDIYEVEQLPDSLTEKL